MHDEPTRRAATEHVTASVIAWLWARGCRVMATEVGYDSRGLGAVTLRSFRADIVAMRASGGNRALHLIEVKGSQADFDSEDWTSDAAHKWGLAFPALAIAPWLAVGPGVDRDRAVMAVGLHWGVIQVDEAGLCSRLRSPFAVCNLGYTDPVAVSSMEVLAATITAQRLPTMMGSTRAEQVTALVTALDREHNDG